MSRESVETIAVNTLRMLSVDMVEAAKSGHPGLPLGAAPAAFVLFHRIMRHDPTDPAWADRDRFILSAGHGSALLYAALHLSGYDLPLEELKRFRQWGSKTPGHPEHGLTPGVEATTGPLGQGFGMGVGLALAERFLAERFNRPELAVIDHYTYSLVSDGDLMEGVSSEAASLAGTLALGKLIYLYDDNHISIEGSTDLAFRENVRLRFEAYGWQVLTVTEGEDLQAIEAAVRAAQAETTRPSLIAVRTRIGFGSPKENTAAVHGEPLGKEAAAATRRFFGWPQEPAFHVPPEAEKYWSEVRERGSAAQAAWRKKMAEYRRQYPDLAAQLETILAGRLPEGWQEAIPSFSPSKPLATRSASGQVLQKLAQKLPHLLGGSADLGPSTKTLLAGEADVGPGQYGGRNLHFGVRELGMAAVANGLALHGGIIPYAATFLVFSDYLRPALRLSALMGQKVIYVFTHDSLSLGEDGPTHQPVEQLMSLRAIPNLTVIRPAEANETAAAWRLALEKNGPTALILSRQDLPILDPDTHPVLEGPRRGGYVLKDSAEPEVILLASGAEVHLALAAAGELEKHGRQARVVSLASWEIFRAQDEAYRRSVLPPEIKARVSVEAGVGLGWREWVGDGGEIVSVDRFGASAPGQVVLDKYGFNRQNVVAAAWRALARQKTRQDKGEEQ